MALKHVWQQAQQWAAYLLGSDIGTTENRAGNCASNSVSSGDAQVDAQLPHGGWPCGVVSWLQADMGMGKTRLALSSINSVQQQGAVAALLDATHSLCYRQICLHVTDPSCALWLRPMTLQQACHMCQQLVKIPAMRLIVIDGFVALPTQQELSGSFAVHMNPRGRDYFLNKALLRLSSIVRGTHTSLLLINTEQLYSEKMFYRLSQHALCQFFCVGDYKQAKGVALLTSRATQFTYHNKRPSGE